MVDDVLAWLADFGLDVNRKANYHKSKGAITVKVSMSDAEDLCTFYSSFLSFLRRDWGNFQSSALSHRRITTDI